MAATTATRAAVAGRLPRTIAVGAPGRRRLSGRRDMPSVADDFTFRAAAPVRSPKANIRNIVTAPKVSAEVAPRTSTIAMTRDSPRRRTTGRDMRMRHPAFHSSLPPSSSSVGLSVKGDHHNELSAALTGVSRRRAAASSDKRGAASVLLGTTRGHIWGHEVTAMRRHLGVGAAAAPHGVLRGRLRPCSPRRVVRRWPGRDR